MKSGLAIERPGPKHNIDITGLVGKRTIAKASCAPEESLVGGGFYVTGFDDAAPNLFPQGILLPNRYKTWVVSHDIKTWAAVTAFDHDGTLTTYAECLKAGLALKQVEQPQPIPTPPPGGPPLQPPRP